MGTRSMNILAIKPGHTLTPEVAKYLNDYMIEANREGALYHWESNFTAMWSRDGRGPNCVHDLLEEAAIQSYLGGLPLDDFFMQRTGAEDDIRGRWIQHPFGDHEVMQDMGPPRGRPMSAIASQALKDRVLDVVYHQGGIDPIKGELLAASHKRTKVGIFIVFGDFDQARFKQGIAEAKAAGLRTDRMYVYGQTATYSGQGICFSKFEEIGVNQSSPEQALA